MYIVVMSVSLLLSHTEKKQKNYFASSDPHQWEEGGHGILEGSWGFGCRGIGGWGGGGGRGRGEEGSWDSRGFLGIRLLGYRWVGGWGEEEEEEEERGAMGF